MWQSTGSASGLLANRTCWMQRWRSDGKMTRQRNALLCHKSNTDMHWSFENSDVHFVTSRAIKRRLHVRSCDLVANTHVWQHSPAFERKSRKRLLTFNLMLTIFPFLGAWVTQAASYSYLMTIILYLHILWKKSEPASFPVLWACYTEESRQFSQITTLFA